MSQDNGQIAIFQAEDGSIRLDVQVEQDTVWLRQEQMGELFGRERSVIMKHIRNVFTEGELNEQSNVQKLHIANSDKPVKTYSLDVIISVGYRVKSQRGTQFRVWASKVLKQYLLQGYALNEHKLKAEQDKLSELKRAIALSSRLLHNKSLSTAESQGILAILEKMQPCPHRTRRLRSPTLAGNGHTCFATAQNHLRRSHTADSPEEREMIVKVIINLINGKNL